jgi:DNA mismatch endonuclease (patch repair protein)
MADIFTNLKRSEIMSRVRNKKTGPEGIVAGMIRFLGVRYRRNVKTLPGQPDFFIRSANLAIFVHGCLWHGHENCNRGKLPATNREFWKKKIATNRTRDARVVRQLRKLGIHVMIIWQCKLRNPEQVTGRLKKMFLVEHNSGGPKRTNQEKSNIQH